MAKETAHQLGTPITSLMGWLEVMDTECGASTTSGDSHSLLNETVSNMKTDVVRLRKIANRFGQIGSVPELNECDVNAIITETAEYYRRRLPFEGKGTQIVTDLHEVPCTALNPELFGWALENLVKNALQSVDPKTGRIELSSRQATNRPEIEISVADNGKGILPAAARKIFRAGFTTKKRGWGLGLTLVKRIVEEYHRGRIILKRSKPGDTVFQITMPLAPSADSKDEA
jgi:signal transduction histidine kinase